MTSAQDYYETYWSSDGYAPSADLPPAVEAAFSSTISTTTDCLDLGCGDGRKSGRWISGHAASYLGADISSVAVQTAQSAGLAAVVIDDATTLPFNDQQFDVVVCMEVLEHLFRPDHACEEILRVLKPSGVLISSVPNVAYWRRRAEMLIGRWNPFGDDQSVTKPWRDPHIRFFNPQTFRRMLVASGFTGVSVEGFGGGLFRDVPGLRSFSPTPLHPLYAMLEQRWPSLLGSRLLAIAERPLNRPTATPPT